MALMMGNDPLVMELAKLLKLPKHTQSFRLSAGAGQAVSVECTFFPERPESIDPLQALSDDYKVRLPEPEPVTAVATIDVMNEVRRSAEGSAGR